VVGVGAGGTRSRSAIVVGLRMCTRVRPSHRVGGRWQQAHHSQNQNGDRDLKLIFHLIKPFRLHISDAAGNRLDSKK
jgi:hypothetical protein